MTVYRRLGPRKTTGKFGNAQLAMMAASAGSGIGCSPVSTMPEPIPPAEPAPIWMAALMAVRCKAQASDDDHAVRWDCIAGRAIYTNSGVDTEQIEPLGVSLQSGQTLAVSWTPGETAYTMEVYRLENGYCA